MDWLIALIEMAWDLLKGLPWVWIIGFVLLWKFVREAATIIDNGITQRRREIDQKLDDINTSLLEISSTLNGAASSLEHLVDILEEPDEQRRASGFEDLLR
jgi:hypothetical protein